MLRDLRIEFEHGERESRAWIPIVPELADARGHVRLGALATLSDVLGGGLAGLAAAPSWIATADLTMHRAEPVTARDGELEVHGRVLRAGRSTVVLECRITAGAVVAGYSTMTFAVLDRRSTNPVLAPTPGAPQRHSMAFDDSRLGSALLDALGIVVRAPGTVALDVEPYVVNSLGATQGGALATMAEVAAESLDPTGRSATIDLQLSYLALAKAGPIVATAQRIGDEGAVRVVVVDAGTERTAAHALARVEALA